MAPPYDEKFFAWVSFTARRSAQALLPVVIDLAKPSSVLDVGCGHGAWLAVWSELGTDDVFGLDGAYVDQRSLEIPHDLFRTIDLTKPWSADRSFDLVQSLEVAEHLPAKAGPTFISCLCAHSDVILFSAAQPGQGGEYHINERDASYWAELFSQHGYAAYDCIRPRIARQRSIDPWYRFNTVLYANAAGAQRLDPQALASLVATPSALANHGDISWRIRKFILRFLPEAAVTNLSRLRYWVALALFRTGSNSQ